MNENEVIKREVKARTGWNKRKASKKSKREMMGTRHKRNRVSHPFYIRRKKKSDRKTTYSCHTCKIIYEMCWMSILVPIIMSIHHQIISALFHNIWPNLFPINTPIKHNKAVINHIKLIA